MSPTQEQAETVEQASPYFDYPQATRYTGLSRQTLWKYVKAGRLQMCGPPAARRFHRDDLDSFMREVGQDQ